uniref:Integral membrane protein n=1 Tax=Streptomyces sp. NBC_00049 TaxID=2903617 RepID=A0AAU2JYL1_9ACTN
MAEEQQSPARREIVTGVPRAARRRPPAHTPARSEISEQTTLGATYVRALMRSQLRAGLGALAALALLLGALPLVFVLPSVAAGPLVWVVLGVLVYPVMWLVARWYVTCAERNEADFTGLVMDPAEAPGGPHRPG